MDFLMEQELKILEQKQVVLLHGTSYSSYIKIQEEGIKPISPQQYSYLCKQEHTAKKYARFATARAMLEGQPVNTGVILEIQINGNELEYDDFNTDEETFQYKTQKIITPQQIKNVNILFFDDLNDKDELYKTVSAFYGGVQKALDFYNNKKNI